MKKLTFLLLLLGGSLISSAYQSISGSLFWLKNQTLTSTDIKVYTVFSSAEPIQPDLNGYLEEIRSDTLFVKILYKEHFTVGSGSSISRNDTFKNIALPASINYLNVSGNMIKINEAGQIIDTLWNKTDSTFALHPVGINNLYKNVPHIAVYPNPANNTLFIGQGPEYQEAHVYNIIGQRVGIYPYNNTKSIDISRLAKGSYFLKLTGKQEESIGWARFVKTAY